MVVLSRGVSFVGKRKTCPSLRFDLERRWRWEERHIPFRIVHPSEEGCGSLSRRRTQRVSSVKISMAVVRSRRSDVRFFSLISPPLSQKNCVHTVFGSNELSHARILLLHFDPFERNRFYRNISCRTPTDTELAPAICSLLTFENMERLLLART